MAINQDVKKAVQLQPFWSRMEAMKRPKPGVMILQMKTISATVSETSVHDSLQHGRLFSSLVKFPPVAAFILKVF